jgi:hypothetical protein
MCETWRRELSLTGGNWSDTRMFIIPPQTHRPRNRLCSIIGRLNPHQAVCLCGHELGLLLLPGFGPQVLRQCNHRLDSFVTVFWPRNVICTMLLYALKHYAYSCILAHQVLCPACTHLRVSPTQQFYMPLDHRTNYEKFCRLLRCSATL